jgi:hypothetical protein
VHDRASITAKLQRCSGKQKRHTQDMLSLLLLLLLALLSADVSAAC